ncbi:MFS transporter [Nocardia sp. NPDC058518]|uniref:MFS transporter n=1 Tax=Nocardia sp. NPDC058518 TaxID=3346534 RepID=UPI00365246C7
MTNPTDREQESIASAEVEATSPWRLAEFRLLLGGQLVSLFGDRVLALVLGIWVKDLTGSSALAGLVFFTYGVPVLAAPVTGWLADRFPRRTVSIAAQVAGTLYLLPLLLVGSSAQLWIVFAVTFCYGAGGAVFTAARGALLADMLPAPVRPRANAIIVSSGQVMTIIGPLIGAGIYSWHGSTVVILIDIASFALSAALLWFLPRIKSSTPAPGQRLFADSLAGVRFLLTSGPKIRTSLALAILFAAIGVFEPVIFQVVTQGLDKPAAFVSVLLVTQGIGAAILGAFTGRLVARLRPLRTMRLAAAGCTGSILLFAVPSTPLVITACVLLGGSFALLAVSVMTYLQDVAPPAQRGRVMAAAHMLMMVPQTLFIAIGSGLVLAVSFRKIILGMACAAAVAYLVAPRSSDAAQ